MGKILKIILLITLSTIGLYFAFYNIDFNNLLNHLLKVDLPKYFAAIILLMISCIIRAKRLQYILVPLDNNISLHHLFSSTMIGYFGNNTLPFKAGEILKSFLLGQNQKISKKTRQEGPQEAKQEETKQEKPKQKNMRKREIAKGIATMVVMCTFIYVSLIHSALRRPNEKNQQCIGNCPDTSKKASPFKR